jgi:hypothetical protein
VSTNGSGIVDTRTHVVQLVCFDSSGNYTLDTTDQANTVTFVAVDHVTSAASTAAARKAPASRTSHLSASGR